MESRPSRRKDEMATNRTRNRTLPPYPTVGETIFENPPFPTTIKVIRPMVGSESCTDVVGNPKGENVFILQKRDTVACAGVSGSRRIGSVVYTAKLCAPTVASTGLHFPVAKLVPGYYKNPNEALAESRPDNPDVNIPVFFSELREAPRMLKHIGKVAMRWSRLNGHPPVRELLNRRDLRQGSEDWLALNFGLRPFLSDLAGISKLARSIEKRHKRFKNWARAGYMSSRSRMGSHSEYEYNRSVVYHLDGNVTWFGSSITEYTTERWCVGKWNVPHYPYESLSSASKYISGISTSASLDLPTIWDGLPWSWMSDWFFDLGDIIKIHSNRYGITYRSSVWMEHQKAFRRVVPYPYSGLTGGLVEGLAERKSRTPFLPLTIPSAKLNWLSAGQLTSLASLFVVKGVR
nr:MAG: hypothetical protein 1 [Leviviridae sp.]